MTTAVADIMTAGALTVEPQETLQRAALLMAEGDVGALPVCSGGQLLGVVTDRDIALRATALGLAPDAACVSDVMSLGAVACRTDDDAAHAMQLMAEHQLRRLPVVDAAGCLVGIVALADIALRKHSGIDATLRAISETTP